MFSGVSGEHFAFAGEIPGLLASAGPEIPRFDQGGVLAGLNVSEEGSAPAWRAPGNQGAEPALPLPCLFVSSESVLQQRAVSIGSKSYLARKAETLFLNLDDMIKRQGLNCVGFETLTFKENLVDRVEAQRRFHSLEVNFLSLKLLEFVCAVQRQIRGAIHYHLICSFPFDIRSGFDFDACRAANRAKKLGDFAEFKRLEAIYFVSANPALRAWWKEMRAAAERFGFGRCETLPVLSNAEAVGRYVGTYVQTEVANRQRRDKGLRTLRYSLLSRKASSRWAWALGAGRNWRMGCAVLGAILQTDDFSEVLGKRWAFNWRKTISAFGRHSTDALAAVAEMSDHYTFDERITRVVRLYELIKRAETIETKGVA